MRSDVYPTSNTRGDSRSLIFKYVRKAPMSRSDISKNAGICKSSVTALTNQMISQGLLTEIGAVDTGVGRRPVLLDIVADHGYAIGVSIGEENFVCISDLRSNVIICKEFIFEEDRGNLPQRIIDRIEDVLCESKIPLRKCVGIGISIAEAEASLRENIKTELERFFNLPTRIDAPTALLCMSQSEAWNENSLLIVLEKNIRSAIVIDGKVRDGGNIEHFSIDCNGAPCHCGSRGCLGSYISGVALRNSGFSDSLDDTATAEHVADKLYCALLSINNLIALKKVIICGISETNGETLINALDSRSNCRSAPKLDISWLELSDNTVKSSVCAAVINEYFENQ